METMLMFYTFFNVKLTKINHFPLKSEIFNPS